MAKKPQKGVQAHKTPSGTVGKGKRLAAQPLGMPSGHHDHKFPATCRCGRCSTK